MLNGFDLETAPLTEYEEKVLLPIVVNSLARKQGKENAVKNAYICKWFTNKGYKATEARIRKIINHIRINGLVPKLIATSAGYYIADDERELNDYIDSLRGRESAIRAVRIAIEKQAGYGNQGR